jgi:CRISPR-associated protein Cas1
MIHFALCKMYHAKYNIMIKRTIFIGNPCHLKTTDEQLVIQYNGVKGQEDMKDKTVPIEDIGVIVLDHEQITLSHRLMEKLLENNASLITCNNKHMPTGMLLNLDGNSLQAERFKHQQDASIPLKKQLWQQTVQYKIANQAAVLKHFNIDCGRLMELSKAVKSGDSDNYEAQAAAIYWKLIFPPAWQFVRHRDGLPPNNLLNYGYAILRAIVARSLVGSGLLPTLGIFHHNKYNAYALADDIMEPYRPYVDIIVLEIIQHTSSIAILTKEIKAKILALPTIDVLIDNEKSPLMIATQRTSASLAKCYIGETRKLIYPIL